MDGVLFRVSVFICVYLWLRTETPSRRLHALGIHRDSRRPGEQPEERLVALPKRKITIFTENCQGRGVIYTEIPAMGEVKSPCEICEGKRFKDEVLEYKLNGKSINDVLEMTVRQALEYFKIDKIRSHSQLSRDHHALYIETLRRAAATASPSLV